MCEDTYIFVVIIIKHDHSLHFQQQYGAKGVQASCHFSLFRLQAKAVPAFQLDGSLSLEQFLSISWSRR